jgi:HD-GYP domain-containing protein (c-di-GMP phosphodiesterase class II)
VSASLQSATIRGTGTCFSLKAVARRSWERAVERAERGEDHRMWPARRILPLLRAGHYLTQMTALDDLLQALLAEVVTVLDAQRGAIVLADEATGKLCLRAAFAETKTVSLAKCFSETLADRCFREGESMLCADVRIEKDLERATSVAQGTMASIICGLLRTPRSNQGVLHLDRGPLQEPFTQDDFDLVDAVACYISVGIETARMLEQQRDLFLHAATTLAQTVEMRDAYTGGHTQRVTVYALLLAEELQMSPAEKHALEIATPLHDIGKIAVDDAVLRKAERLTEAEDVQMRTHVIRGAALLANIPGLAPMLPIVRNHHERWDGRGYPDGQQGGQIASVARVVAIADAFDAMTSDRPYRKGLPLDEAFRELSAKAGTHFDPTYVAAFLSLRAKIERVMAAAAVVLV